MVNNTIVLDGWFKGQVAIFLPEDLTKEEFEEINGDNYLSFDMAKSLSENGEKTGEYLPVSSMADFIGEDIKYQIIENGDTCGTVKFDCSKEIEWQFDTNITLEGKETSFSELSDDNRNRIIDSVLGGCNQGELIEYREIEEEYNIDPLDASINF